MSKAGERKASEAAIVQSESELHRRAAGTINFGLELDTDIPLGSDAQYVVASEKGAAMSDGPGPSSPAKETLSTGTVVRVSKLRQIASKDGSGGAMVAYVSEVQGTLGSWKAARRYIETFYFISTRVG